MNIFNYNNQNEFTQDAAAAIEDFMIWKLQEEESVSIALSGGSSPLPIYKALANNKKIEWNKVELFMVDERYVSPNSQDSNFKMIEETLLSKIEPIKFFHAFNTHLPVETSAEEYDDLLESRGKKCFDLVILGMGEDGHTASLFPESEALKEKTKLVTTSHSPDGLERLTITLPAIFTAEKVMFLIQGKNKKKKVAALLDEKVSERNFPAKIVTKKHSNVDLFIFTE